MRLGCVWGRVHAAGAERNHACPVGYRRLLNLQKADYTPSSITLEPAGSEPNMFRFVYSILIGALVVFSGGEAAQAQVPSNCDLEALDDPERFLLRCEGGLVLEIEAEAVVTYQNEEAGLPGQIIVEQGAVLVEMTPGGFTPQIRTPNAITAVRGTTYAIEVSNGATAVFVVTGQVDVRKIDNADGAVLLGAGEGVDVRGDEPLAVAEWSDTRARALLARFGR